MTGLLPRWAPPDGVHVPQPHPGPGADLSSGSPCSQQSCPASQSHGNSCCSCLVPYSSPPAWPCLTLCLPRLAPTEGLVLMARKTLTGTRPHPGHPIKWPASLYLSLPMARSTFRGSQWVIPGGSPKCVAALWEDPWGLQHDTPRWSRSILRSTPASTMGHTLSARRWTPSSASLVFHTTNINSHAWSHS